MIYLLEFLNFHKVLADDKCCKNIFLIFFVAPTMNIQDNDYFICMNNEYNISFQSINNSILL